LENGQPVLQSGHKDKPIKTESGHQQKQQECMLVENK
jgi:hypothetical protein